MVITLLIAPLAVVSAPLWGVIAKVSKVNTIGVLMGKLAPVIVTFELGEAAGIWFRVALAVTVNVVVRGVIVPAVTPIVCAPTVAAAGMVMMLAKVPPLVVVLPPVIVTAAPSNVMAMLPAGKPVPLTVTGVPARVG